MSEWTKLVDGRESNAQQNVLWCVLRNLFGGDHRRHFAGGVLAGTGYALLFHLTKRKKRAWNMLFQALFFCHNRRALFFGLCPRILERYRTVEHQAVFGGVRVHGKVPVSHELEGLARLGTFEGFLQLAPGKHQEGIGV